MTEEQKTRQHELNSDAMAKPVARLSSVAQPRNTVVPGRIGERGAFYGRGRP